jgi:glycosidase
VSANDGVTTVESSFTFLVNSAVQVAALPAGAKDGVTMINNGTSAIFDLYAPGKNNIYVIGDFNNWQGGTASFMKKTPDGNNWWVQMDGLNPNTEYAYQYLIDGNLKVADPYSHKVLDPINDPYINAATYPNLKAYPTGKTTGIVSAFTPVPAAYNWQVNNFQRPKKADLVIYELLVRDFVGTHNYQTLIDTLSYLQNLGVNAIELMPVTEFEGNDSWGYNVSFHLAADKYYGTQNKLKEFIDVCHSKGIAVILDMVLNHAFGQNPMVQMYWDSANSRPAANSPWFNPVATHPFNVGYDFNHESPATKYYTKNVFSYWQSEYKIDGFRFDLSKGFTQRNNPNDVAAWSAYDASRIAIWKDYYHAMTASDPNLYVILEHFADNTEEKELSDYGMMLWGNMNHNYNEATMGYVSTSDLSLGVYKNRGWTNPNLVTYMESHDEERLMFKNEQFGNVNGAYSTKDVNTALKRMELASAFFFTLPGPKMIWQFGERGYDLSINYPSNTANDRLTAKPPMWDYMTNTNRKALYTVYAKLIKLRIAQPVFETTDFTYNLTGAVKIITLNDPALKVVVVGNFDVQSQSATVTFPNTGKWYDYLTRDSITVNNTAYNYSLAAGEYHVLTSRNLNGSNTATAIKEDVIAKDGTYFYNYPNPAIHQTTFVYNLSTKQMVSLKIYDLLGREVADLLNTEQNVGEHEIKWNSVATANGLEGLYFAKLKIGQHVKTIKVLLQR